MSILKIFLILMILNLCSILFSQDLSQKKQQLEDLKEEINKQEKLIEDKEKIKNEKQSDLKNTQNKHRETEKKIKKLTESERKAKKELDDTLDNIARTDLKIEDLDLLCELEFNNLFVSHYDKKYGKGDEIDPIIIAAFIDNTVQEMKTTLGYKGYLEKQKEKTNKSYESFVWSLSNTKKRKKQYQNQMNTLKTDLTVIEKERLEALHRKQQLEEEANALDDLITKLQSEIMNEEFSYKFSYDKLIWPVKGEIIRPFGLLKADQYKVSTRNNGIDIAIAEGTPVKVVDDGVVAFAEWYEGAGKLVIIDHQNGYYTLYSHNSLLLVSKGDRVYKEQEIALSGTTGSADCSCLHFEIRKRGTPINPLDFLE